MAHGMVEVVFDADQIDGDTSGRGPFPSRGSPRTRRAKVTAMVGICVNLRIHPDDDDDDDEEAEQPSSMIALEKKWVIEMKRHTHRREWLGWKVYWKTGLAWQRRILPPFPLPVACPVHATVEQESTILREAAVQGQRID